MLFYRYIDAYRLWFSNPIYPSSSKQIGFEEFYEASLDGAESIGDVYSGRQFLAEKDWVAANRPYYNVWPAIWPMVEKLDLDIPCSVIKPPAECISLLFSQDRNPYEFKGGRLQSVLVSKQVFIDKDNGCKEWPTLCIFIDVGERSTLDGSPVYTVRVIPLFDNMTVEQVLARLPNDASASVGLAVPDEISLIAAKVACTVCLIADDPDLVTPDILTKDRLRFTKADEDEKLRLVSKARKRGKNGFDIGREVTVNPHYRNAHLAKFWCGAGRTELRVKLRSGSLVKRSKVTKVPTGYEG